MGSMGFMRARLAEVAGSSSGYRDFAGGTQMGESSDTALKLQFDRRVRLDFRGAAITSDAGFLACRELDAALGLTETANDYIHESRTGRNIQHQLVPLAQTIGV